MLIVRDLLLGPKRFTDLHRGLPRIPTNVLSTRLKELEQAGVVRRRLMPRPASSVVYELTEYGAQLEEIVLQLGRWGAQSMGEPRELDIVTPDSLMLALRATFEPSRARGLRASYELHFGPVLIHALIDDGALETGEGPLPNADLVVETGPIFRALIAHEVTPAEALQQGQIHLTGDAALLDRFVDVFRIQPLAAAS